MAICKTCGKKYSKWTTPVSAKGVCRECFEAELKPSEPEAELQQHLIVSEEPPGEKSEESPGWTPSIAVVACGGIVLSVLVLLLFVSFVASLGHSSLYNALSALDRWASLIGNLVVVFVTFPVFRRTKDRAFLFLAVGALCFAYSVLWSLLFGIQPPVVAPVKWTYTSVQIYYVMRYAVHIIGLASYTWGVTLLARRSRLRSARKTSPSMTDPRPY